MATTSLDSQPTAAVATAARCRCCESDQLDSPGTKRGRFHPRDFRFFRCRDCGFLFVEPVTDFSIYDDAYYDGRGPDPLVNYREEYQHYATTPRRYEFENLVALAADHLSGTTARARGRPPSPVQWLDFGCGAGGLLKYLRDLDGLELRSGRVPVIPVGHDVGSYAQRLQSDDGFEILESEALEKTAAGRFDVITCIEVVEHIPRPRPMFESLARCLKPGGLLILTTGNLASPLARWQGIEFAYCIPEIHISLFTPELLARLYAEVGLVPVRLRFDGMLKFRFLKNLARLPIFGKILTPLATLPPALRFADWLFGVSAMPSAIKPEGRPG